MQHFEASGRWYPFDDPDNAVGGTLKFDDNGLQLVLLGTFHQGWSPEAKRYSIIHGVVGDCPYGAFVTLIDNFRTGQKFNMVGATSEKIRCHQAAIGNFHLPDGPISLEYLELDFSYLTDWAGRTGIRVDRNQAGVMTYIATYEKPENLAFPFGDKSLVLGCRFNAHEDTHTASFSEAARLLIEPVGEISPTTVGRDHVRTLQDLLSFATDTPNQIEEIAYGAEKDARGLRAKFNLIYEPVFRLKERKDSLHSIDMLFTLADSQAAGINIFQRWLDFSKKHQSFCEVYFGHNYTRPKFLDDRFKKVMVAFTLLCSTLDEMAERDRLFLESVETALKAHFPENEWDFLGHVIPSWGEVEMPIILHRMLVENSDLMCQVIEDYPAFVRSVSDTLAFVERRVEGPRSPLNGGEIHYATEKVKTLIKIVVLRELGFGRGDVKTLLERNKHFNHLASI